jgi:hypothetical protein
MPFVVLDTNPLNNAAWDRVTCNNICRMVNGSRALKYYWNGAIEVVQNWGVARPPAIPTFSTVAGTLNLTTGRKYRVSYKNGFTGETSTATFDSGSTGPLVNKKVQVAIVPPTDPQVDAYVWWATLDGGSDFFFHSETSVPNLSDQMPDTGLTKSRRAPYYNDPPPSTGRYLTEWGGRIFIIDGQEVAYSGYERILEGPPESCFPPNNRIRLSVGADKLQGIGAVPVGIVVWSRTNEMFMLRGVVEDIISGAPVAYSAFLEKLPWEIGLASHWSVRRSPSGLVFLSSTFNVMVFGGSSRPNSISDSVAPILKRITVGQKDNVRSEVWTYLEKTWYILAVPLDGSTVLNKLFVFDLDPDAETNVGVFHFDIECESIAVVEDRDGNPRCLIGSQGRVKELILISDTEGGITANITSTSGILPAWWHSGLFGNEDADTIAFTKLYRWARVVADQGGFTLRVLVYGDDLRNPEYIDKLVGPDGKIPLNMKGRRCSIEIGFPDQDVSANALELSLASFTLSKR